MENRSCRGKLVEVVVESFIKDNLFNSVDVLKENLQERLNLNLNFKTDVSDIETKNEHNFGNVFFEGENGDVRVIDFTITSNKVNF